MSSPSLKRAAELAALVVAVALLGSCGNDRPPLDRARALVEDNGTFSTAVESGDTFAHVGELLRDAADECETRCAGVREASAYAQVLAADVLRCTQPGIHDARAAVLALLAAVKAAPTIVGNTPALPDC